MSRLGEVAKKIDQNSIIQQSGAYVEMARLTSALLQYGRKETSATLRGDQSSYLPEIEDVVQKVCLDDVKTL